MAIRREATKPYELDIMLHKKENINMGYELPPEPRFYKNDPAQQKIDWSKVNLKHIVNNLENYICDNCNKSDVCKHKESLLEIMKSINDDVSKLPIDVIIRCHKWSRQIVNTR